MQDKIERARDLLPSIIITVLSMIQALALELYWNRFQDSDFLWLGGWDATIGWLQMLVMLMGMLLVWLMYVSLVLRFRWLPSMEDTLVPFGIGLLEFGMISLMGVEHLGPWFLALAGVFAVTVTAAHTAHRRARQDPDNAYFFDTVAPASWRDYLLSAAFVGTLALLGAGLILSGNHPVLAILGLLFAVVTLGYQLLISRRYWMHTLVSNPTTDTQGV